MGIREFHKMIAPLQRRLQAMLARSVLEGINDSTELQSLQVSLLAGEVADQVERFQEYGVSSRPLEGAEAICLFLSGGQRGHPVVVAVDDPRYRPKDLAPGDTCIYTDQDAGDDAPHRIILTRDGTIKILTGDKTSAVFDRDKIELKVGNSRLLMEENATRYFGPKWVWDEE